MRRLSHFLGQKVKPYLVKRGFLFVRYHNHKRLLVEWQARSGRPTLLSQCDALQLISCVEATNKVPGCIAEVGVASGVSSRLIAEHSGGRTLHLFDTFEGLPQPDAELDAERFKINAFSWSLESVRQYLSGTPAVYHKGVFPKDTGDEVTSERFSFVHLDVDLYESTIECLKFFYSRMSPGGMILSHDYITARGVNRAYREFFADKSEPILEMIGDQCLVVKI
jgi:hypothetical protein